MTDPTSGDPASFWNDKFDRPDYRYGTRPNQFIADTLPDLIAPGDAVLCVGDGEGRNGVWCARQGYETTSLEPSSVGIEKIRRLADEHGVAIDTIHDAMPSDDVDDESFDAVVLTFIHAPEPMRRAIHQSCIDALRPGGVVVLEGFHPDQRHNDRKSGGPPDPSLMFTAELLESDFENLEFELLEEQTVDLDEGDGHCGAADVVRMIARKPR